MQYCGTVALIGAPNAGKSTLINQMVGAKVSIVTPKVQTTRNIIRGIGMYPEVDSESEDYATQLIFIDTPGIFAPKKRMDHALVNAAWQGVEGAGVILLLVDAKKGITDEVVTIIKELKKRELKATLVINKVDAVKKEKLLELSIKLFEQFDFEKSFMISALKDNGVSDLLRYLCSSADEGNWLFPEDQVSDMPNRFLAQEITREQCFLQLNQEIPYSLMVETEQWEEDDKSIIIHQAIYVEREGQKQIILGKGGAGIKRIGEKARKQLGVLLDKRVNLFLFVKVRENWQDSQEAYRIMGLNNG